MSSPADGGENTAPSSPTFGPPSAGDRELEGAMVAAESAVDVPAAQPHPKPDRSTHPMFPDTVLEWSSVTSTTTKSEVFYNHVKDEYVQKVTYTTIIVKTTETKDLRTSSSSKKRPRAESESGSGSD